jgi:hypothetical protein
MPHQKSFGARLPHHFEVVIRNPFATGDDLVIQGTNCAGVDRLANVETNDPLIPSNGLVLAVLTAVD